MSPPSTPRRLPLRVLAVYAAILAALLLFFTMIGRYAQNRKPGEEFKAPDDIRAARELLATRFTGPRYFQITTVSDRIPYPCIETDDARHQVAGIVAARGLPSSDAATIDKLITKLAEPPASRVIGVEHVNVLQLNLALDEP